VISSTGKKRSVTLGSCSQTGTFGCAKAALATVASSPPTTIDLLIPLISPSNDRAPRIGKHVMAAPFGRYSGNPAPLRGWVPLFLPWQVPRPTLVGIVGVSTAL
jgi:hypothetical protein